ncbi:hypothetical protein EF808_04180 [archaeon]|nr:MAG: hypothetical protein EF808_04180 [archaeon]
MKGKIVALCIAGMFLLAGLAGMAAAKKPDNRGFDEFGYNDHARLFNGWYGHYDRDIEGGTGDSWLLMKWSKDWDPMTDQPIGAWCTNHFTWYSDDYEEETWFGWDTRVAWNEETSPEADYKVKEFLKVMKVSDDEQAWERYAQGGAYSAGWGTYESGVPKYVVFQDTITVYDAQTGEKIATYDLCETSPKGLGNPIF